MSNQQFTTLETGAGPGVGRATGFELARRNQLGTPRLDSALARTMTATVAPTSRQRNPTRCSARGGARSRTSWVTGAC
jgi:hypothetical protein